MRKTIALCLMISLSLCTFVISGCSDGDKAEPSDAKDNRTDTAASALSQGTHALKSNTFKADIAAFSRGSLGVCYAGTDIFLVSTDGHAQNQCIQPNGLEKHTYLLISVSKFDNGEFEIGKSDVYHEIVKTKNTSQTANVAYIDETGSSRVSYQALSGHVVLSGIAEKTADTWKSNSGVSVELKDAVFYDFPKYIISCAAPKDGGPEHCICEEEDSKSFDCDPQKIYDETNMQTFTYNQKFDLIPCETLTNVPDLDPRCE